MTMFQGTKDEEIRLLNAALDAQGQVVESIRKALGGSLANLLDAVGAHETLVAYGLAMAVEGLAKGQTEETIERLEGETHRMKKEVMALAKRLAEKHLAACGYKGVKT